LYYWVYKQKRCRYDNTRHGVQLNEEQVSKLESIGFDFTVDDQPRQWREKMRLLKDSSEKHGHCNPQPGDGPLAKWVSTQKRRRHGPCGQWKQLKDWQIAELEKLG